MAKVHRNSLKPGHRVHWYEILEVLGQGGFGITYLATDINLAQQVAIKEYLPIELAVRMGDDSVHPVSEDRGAGFEWGLEKFIAEAQTLAQFNHPNIVHVFTVFEANNTAYMVMRYEDGQSLQEILTRRKTLEEADLLKILIPILGGLTLVHDAGFIHRDIKPANIFIRRDRSPVLLDFGSARQALGERSATLTSLVTPGYAPFEQYYSKSDDQGPWTDIYGLGATLYRAVTGITPTDAIDRSKSIVEGSKEHFVVASEIAGRRYSKRFLRAIDHALAFKPHDRPQTIADWLAEFRVPAERAGVEPKSADSLAQRTRRLFVLSLCLVIAAAGGSLVVGDGDRWIAALDRMTPALFRPRSADGAEDTAVALNRIRERTLAEQRTLLAQAESYARAGHRLEPRGANALEHYEQILKRVPDHPQALAGKRRLLDHFLDRAKAFIAEARFNEADGALLRAAVVDAERLLDKVCYEVLGRWEYKRLFGTDTMVLKEGGAIDYHSTVSGSGRWECASPGSRTFRITLTAAGFSNTWSATLSADGACLDAAHGGCFVPP